MSNETDASVFQEDCDTKYNRNNCSSGEYKIQTIICVECKQVLGARIVSHDEKSSDLGFCRWCFDSIISLAEYLELDHIPGKLEFNRVWPPQTVKESKAITWAFKVFSHLKD